MGGGLMELVAKGAQDIYLTGNPNVTYFKSIFKRHILPLSKKLISLIYTLKKAFKQIVQITN